MRIYCEPTGDGKVGLQSIKEDTFDTIGSCNTEFSGFDIFRALKDEKLFKSNNVFIFTVTSVTEQEIKEMLSCGA